MLILHFIGLAMGIGTSFAFLFLKMAAAKLPLTERGQFMLRTLPVARMGHIGLGLLILSGGYLMTPYWGSLGQTPLLIAKLTLVLVLIVVIGIVTGISKKARTAADPVPHLKKIGGLGPVSMIIALLIVICAVYVFH